MIRLPTIPITLGRARRAVAASLALLSLLAAPLQAREPQMAVTIVLRAHVQVDRPEVTLNDIADLSAADLGDLRRLMRLPIGTSPAIGRPATLTGEAIRRWVQTRTGWSASRMVWAGAETVEVRAAMHTVAGDEIVLAARTAMRERLAGMAARVVIDASAPVPDIELPPGHVQLQARPLSARLAPAKRMLVWIDVLVDGRKLRAVPVQLEIAAYVGAWVASEELAAGSKFTAQAVEARDVDIAALPEGTTVRQQADTFVVAGEAMRVRTALHRGQVLTLQNCEKAPMVVRGEFAMIKMHRQLLALEGRVQVLQDGLLGQMVRVRAPSAGATLLATVTGPGVVEAQ